MRYICNQYFSKYYKLIKGTISMKVIGKKHYNQYTLKEIIGTGSFGKVYSSPPYAIKEMCFQGMAPYLLKALKNQIDILKKINHTNIVKLVDHFYEGPNAYLVMEYCESDLAKFLKKNKKIPEEKALGIIKQILAGFRELVKNQVIHRDLKPANILVNSKGEFKLADFGFAKFVNHYDSKLLYSIVGTPLYMAPQILAKKQYTTKCDIWSIGFIFYEMLTGTFPWMGVSQSDLLKNINNRPLNIPTDLSSFSKNMISRMLTVKEKDRISWDELFREFLKTSTQSKQTLIDKFMPKLDLFGGKENRDKSTEQTPRNRPQRTQANTPRNHDQQKQPSKKKIFTNRNLNLSPEKNRNPQPKTQRAISEKKLIEKPENNKNNPTVDCIVCYENVFIQLMQIELERLYDEKTALNICWNLSGKMDSSDSSKFQRALEHFNEQFRMYARKIWKLN